MDGVCGGYVFTPIKSSTVSTWPPPRVRELAGVEGVHKFRGLEQVRTCRASSRVRTLMTHSRP